MARGMTLNSFIRATAREVARQKRLREAEQRRQERARIVAQKEHVRLLAQAEKEAKAAYVAGRVAEVGENNEELKYRLTELRTILEHTLTVDDAISFDSLRIREEFPAFEVPLNLRQAIGEPTRTSFMPRTGPPSVLGRLIPGALARYDARCKQAEQRYVKALSEARERERERRTKIAELENEYQAKQSEYLTKKQQRDCEVDEFERTYRAGEPSAILAYSNMVLERSEYPDGFPQEFKIAYVQESNQLVIEYELPSKEVIPTVEEYSYVKSKDQISEKTRKAVEVKAVYQEIVAATTLRTIHELFESDKYGHVLVVVFNGFVQTIDPTTGQSVRPCLISVRATRERFLGIDLSRIDKIACLRNLGAQVSSSAHEAVPVKPIVEFDMVDKRFVEQSDVLADLESRPNLMELSPFEFENLVSNLFQEMGLETKQTRSSRDGGVDAVAFDTRPVLGGKVVIQAKRYRDTVGVSAVRDLYGTMMNEGANKGILVTTSGYGPDAYEFCRDKPIELIDGGGLLYLLEEAGIKARIVVPAGS